MGSLSSRFNRPESGVMHSNAIASVSPGSFGNTSTETFGQRKSIDSSRAHVKNFRHAGVIHAYQQQAAVVRNETTPATTAPTARRNDVVIPTRQAFNATPSVHHKPITKPPLGSARREPPSRGYNPYA